MALPIERPGKIVCVGLNYRRHAEEQGAKLPERPMLFAKWQTALVGPGEPIRLPGISTAIDYEAELGVVIGERAKGVPAVEALAVVRGYLCANDVTARDLQRSDRQYSRAKSLDTFCPVGDLVPAADVPDPQALRIRCVVNDEVRQDSTTADMIFSVAEVIAFVSEAMTLEPGDLLLTGTPAGVGAFRDPPLFLADGDEVRVEIDGLPSLTNPVLGSPEGVERGRVAG
ncbi:MAG: fumarylacetoacetate hydrolase family protein [Actinomycetota bacterium]|nr:fumarylacetoacetate hydrolase family protein [Actinomycetota bacterium]